ncbi:PilZ domain-containing protein [Psychrosphaera aquimarina]|jgi:hypothetical protein|uniref:Cyclic diguanosine monophosphate-binding protein n=1 Tax=Psychrosphaera aquimarina TaxID=2044854 RepID=A0ABU3QZY6_9GAMM|nr:PilZ domain-containing protein [Psychrosphaera aquimarina]MDU0112767.1 PilZ domain-containing protein [Psychrosphaera aquimarina]
MEDNRRFTRIIFSTPAQLTIQGQTFQTSLVDLSLKGALVSYTQELDDSVNKSCTLSFTLPDTEIEINIEGSITHVEHHNIGIVCSKIDLDSVSHLKRLIALNLGNEDILDRELTSLTYP